MTQQREKILFFIAVGVMALGMACILYFKMLVEPARELRRQAAATQQEIGDLELQVERGATYRARLSQWAAASFASDDLRASELARAHLVQLLNRARLNTASVTLTPVTGRSLKGAREIGWMVKARGPLDRVIDFLYLLQSDPRLHKLENISWLPVPKSGDVELSLKYATLVLESSAGEKPAEVAAETPGGPDPLAGPARRQYALISQRDVFRPYIKRPPPPPAPQQTPATPIDRQTLLKVVGLPTWDGTPAVVVRDSQANATRTYKVGQQLIGGQIVMVDYRPLPRSDKPYLDSPSRVIVRIGGEHWAVELGQTLAEKRKLAATQVPAELANELQTTEAKPVTQEDSDAP